jgi:4-hydroxybenzoate polyprenyltransferase
LQATDKEHFPAIKGKPPNARVGMGGGTKLIGTVLIYLKLLRPHQWSKNVLIFVPMAAAHALSGPTIGAALLAFASFNLCASGGYILNDILDRKHDQKHIQKQLRPLASGIIPISHAAAVLPMLWSIAVVLALRLPIEFMIVLAGYLSCSVIYSLILKRKLMIDVVTLAALYGVRVVAGGAACTIPLSEWLIIYSFFVFLSLALMKRTSEIVSLPLSEDGNIAGRGYRRSDLTAVMILSGASAFVCVLVFAFYVNSEHVRSLYAHPELLWGVAAVLVYWLGRSLILAGRGSLHQDPIVFALTDRATFIAGTIAAGFVLAAL